MKKLRGICRDCRKQIIKKRSARCRNCNDKFRKGTNSSRYKHGLRKTRFYKIFYGILARCKNKNFGGFKKYGAKGIKCLWYSFEEFKNDMYESYIKHVSEFGESQTQIDRTDCKGNYSKENCRWVTLIEQARNRGNTRYLNFRGTKKSIFDWSTELNIPYKTLKSRIGRNWDAEKALTQPIRIQER